MTSIRLAAAAILVLALAASPSGADPLKLDTPLRFLRTLHQSGLARARGGASARAAAGDAVTVTARFSHELGAADVAALEGLGCSFFRLDGAEAHSGPVYTVYVPWDGLDAFAARGDVVRVASAWRPAVLPTLDLSAPETQADSAWARHDGLGLPLTGRGMRIADFDTGIDVFHPSFFLADGDTLEWIDWNANGHFDNGDAVDLNGNGVVDASESLRYYDGWIYDPAMVWGAGSPSNLGNGYQAWWDWLYNDADYDGVRDLGPGGWYGETSPGYGEPVFIALDADGDGELDLGEKLVQLGTSKVLATLGAGGVERIRGTDLIYADPDPDGHGTSVCGILAGGTVGRHRFTGLAPEAELLPGDFFAGNPISSLIPWARARGADVMLYEFGDFIWQFLDGSSIDEELIAAENATTIQVTPSGNLGRGHKHALAAVAAHDSVRLRVSSVAYGSDASELYYTTLWRTDQADLVFRLRSPLGALVTLDPGVTSVDGYYLWFERATSPRGTCAFNLYVHKDLHANVHGTWEVWLVNGSAAPVETVDNVTDDVSAWAGGAEFLDHYTDQQNVTWPATADAALVNGSYSTRGFEGYGGVGGGTVPPGQISVFSGRGPRMDGLHLLDLCTPGNYDVYTTRTHQDVSGYAAGVYRQFSGTSAAGPHAAAAVALVKQAFANLTNEEVVGFLTASAGHDAFTGPGYNDTWGWGKLRILDAILSVPVSVEPLADAPRVQLGPNRPNPFGTTTWIPFSLRADGPASVRIYSVRGELVKVLSERRLAGGAHGVRWDGDDRDGRPVPPGVYFCVLRAGGLEQSRKVVRVR